MDDGHGREVLRPPARAAQTAAEVRLLRVDEELLVEEADLVERLAAEEERGRHGPVDVARLAPTRLDDARTAEGEQAEPGGRGRREAPGRVLKAAVGIDEPWPERGDPRIRVQVSDHSLEPPVLARRVLVEDEDVAAGRGADHGVVVGAEARPVPLLDHANVGEPLANGSRRAVLRGVVEDDDLHIRARQRFETRKQKLARVRVDEGDRDVRH